jgi:hypothetical protein
MDRAAVMQAVKERVKTLPGVIAFEFLEGEFRQHLIDLEHEAESNGACGGLMPFTNEGVWEAFKRQVQFVIVADSSAIILGVSNGLVYIRDQKGQIVGEWLTPERVAEMKDRTDVCRISDDFVMYSGLDIVGEPYFVLPKINFPYLDSIEGVKDVASGSISTLADDYIRYRLGFGDTRHWTHLVGFNIVP